MRMTAEQVAIHQATKFKKPSTENVSEPVGRESKLHEQIFNFCRGEGWICFHGSMANRTHRTEGEPDFVILSNAGRVHLIECKSRSGKLSPAQRAMACQAYGLGHYIHEVRNFDEFLKIVKPYPALTPYQSKE